MLIIMTLIRVVLAEEDSAPEFVPSLTRSSAVFPGLEGTVLDNFRRAVQRFQEHLSAMSSPESRAFLKMQSERVSACQYQSRPDVSATIIFLMLVLETEKALDRHLAENYVNR